MGAGLARDCFVRYPQQSTTYSTKCKRGGVTFDKPLLVESDGIRKYEKKLLFVATKDHFRDPSEYKWIFRSIAAISALADKLKPPSIAIPALGCGLGGLNYEVVSAWLFDLAWFHPDITFYFFPPRAKVVHEE